MSQAVITLAFEQWKAQQAATNEAVTLDEFVFAHVPDLDVDAPIDREEEMPPAAQIVHRQAVSRKGVVNDNAVVHSVVLGADTGDFTFNWVGLINKASGTLAMIVHAPEQQKLKTKEGQQGNVLTRSFLMEFNGAQAETGIDTPAETWQIDFTARMAGMDERQRLENVDIYGAGAFFDDGYLVAKSGTQYYVTKGAGYVAGLRSVLAANQNIVIAAKPVKVWLDVCWSGSLTSVWTVQSKITVAANLADYVQGGVQHYVFAVASIDENGSITDLRPKGSLAGQQSIKDFMRKDANLSDLYNVSVARQNLELGSAAVFTAQTSTVDSDLTHLMRVGAFGIGGNRIEVSDSSIYDFFPGKPGGHYGAGSKDNRLTSGWLNAIWTQHGIDKKYGSLLEIGSDCGLALHIQNGESGWNGARFYSTAYKPLPADLNVIERDACNTAGFRGGDIGLPYMRHSETGTPVELATKSWSNTTFQVKGNYIGQDECNTAGFRGGDSTLPYMRHTKTATPIELATKSWSNTTFQVKGNYIGQDECNTAGFRGGDSTLPYMRNAPTNSVIELQLKNTASKAVNGWHKDTSTGIITQWGTASGGGDDQYYTVNTPIAFPSAFVSLQVYPIYSGAITSGHTLSSAGKINSTSQFGYGISDGSASSINAQGVYWIAKGY